MTLYGLLASLAWALTGALFIARLDRFAHRWLSLKQREQIPVDATIPDDLQAFAMLETEKWAADATLKVIREKWESFRDWNKVRASLGVGTVDGD